MNAGLNGQLNEAAAAGAKAGEIAALEQTRAMSEDDLRDSEHVARLVARACAAFDEQRTRLLAEGFVPRAADAWIAAACREYGALMRQQAHLARQALPRVTNPLPPVA